LVNAQEQAAQEAFGRGERELALRLQRGAVEQAPSAGGWMRLSDMQQDMGQSDDAIESCRQSLRLDPMNSCEHAHLGFLLLGKGQLPEAEASFRQGLALGRRTEDCVGLGVALDRQGRVDEAEASYREAIALDPENDEAMYNLGALLSLQRHQYTEAIALFRRAIEIDPQYGSAYRELGLALKRTGACLEAERCLQRAVALDGKDMRAHLGLGVLYSDTKRYEEALPCLERACKLATPGWGTPFMILADVKLRLGDGQAAHRLYLEAAAIEPNRGRSLYTVARGLARAGDDALARQFVERCLALPLDEDTARQARALRTELDGLRAQTQS
jgi:Tfp pilus assembly protein PilF